MIASRLLTVLGVLAWSPIVLAQAGSVKSEQKISEVAGGFGGVLDIEDVFGRSVAPLGDLDGDGIGDLAVGAPHDTGEGAVWILFLDVDGTVKHERRITEGVGGFGGWLQWDDYFGTAIAPLGDLDGDGVGDLAVDAPGDDDGGTQAGAVWILFLNSDGTVKREQKISEIEGGFGGDLDDLDNFGSALAPVGDLDGDGVDDLAVGAWADDDGALDAGAVWILFLNPDGTVEHEQKISATAGGFGGSLHAETLFGSAIGYLGDHDGDGIGDLSVGAFWDDDGGESQGAVWILFLNSDGTVKNEQKISAMSGGFGGTLDENDAFGCSLASIGDLDGDGIDDLAVGAALDDDGGSEQGALWILFLDDDGTVKSERKISATEGGFAGPLDPHDFFGSSACSLGDQDGDGIVDLAVGAHFDDDGGHSQGAVWILFLLGDLYTKYCVANPNSTGAPADLSATGSTRSAAGDLELHSSPVPNGFGVFFHGANQSQLPFGNGFQCTTGGVFRGALVVGSGNVATYAYDNSDAKHDLSAFVHTTRNFQHWFRDPMGGGALFNTSNAISVAILP